MTSHPSQGSTATRLRATGARVTGARVAILELLTRANRALSHREVEVALESTHIDRVTVYRVLDWLTSEGLAHKIADDERVYRFSVVGRRDDPHVHFKCRTCGNVFCLPAGNGLDLKLPRGFHGEEIELAVRGVCADCSG